LPFYALLSPEQQHRFQDDLKIFVHEKHFIGAAGLSVTEGMRVVIGGAAVRLTLGLDLSYYDRLTEIIVYPHDYRHADAEEGVITLGEAHDWGTVVLSWPAVLRGLANSRDGRDTAAHEFAHVLDRAGGNFNGTPPLRANEHYRVWAQIMDQQFRALRAGAPGVSQALRRYGATNEAEFFAVATEVFFEQPDLLKAQTPALYKELQRFYGVEPQHQKSSDGR
jgi:hypothetical protein